MLDERKLEVLKAIVTDYVASQEPVGSKALVERHQLNVSPATVRNDMAVLEDEGAPERVIFHCFSGDAAMAAHCAERGWYLSFAGVVTYSSAGGLRDALRVVPDDLVLVETDAPYLTPVPHRGRPNASYLMPWTVRAMARERGVSEVAMCGTLWDNAQRVFGAW